MAVTMELRLDESSGALPHVKVLMLLDRRADVHLAKRCGAEAWLVKPVDALTLEGPSRNVLEDPSPARRWKNLGEGSHPDEDVAGDPSGEQSAEEEPPLRGSIAAASREGMRGVAQLG